MIEMTDSWEMGGAKFFHRIRNLSTLSSCSGVTTHGVFHHSSYLYICLFEQRLPISTKWTSAQHYNDFLLHAWTIDGTARIIQESKSSSWAAAVGALRGVLRCSLINVPTQMHLFVFQMSSVEFWVQDGEAPSPRVALQHKSDVSGRRQLSVLSLSLVICSIWERVLLFKKQR